MPTRKPLVEIDRKIREQRQQIEGQSLFEGFVRPDEINKLNDLIEQKRQLMERILQVELMANRANKDAMKHIIQFL